jgi:pimeloyl-ACP methyl ester carboxylesterase
MILSRARGRGVIGTAALPAAAVFAWLAASPANAAKHDRPAEVDSPAAVKPGTTGLCRAKSKGMQFFLRVPRKYDPRAGARLIVFLHGSSMNGLQYLQSFEEKKWCADDILCCPNGETGPDPFGQRNFGFGSGPAVADVTDEVQKAFKTTVTYLGGHSQGAFLTYNVILNHPDRFHGAFPMAGDCWIQNEPNLWQDKPQVLARQKQIAIAVIHGKSDPVVKFSQGEHAYDCFRAMGWTRLRLFAPDNLNHMFMLAPIDEALEWLDAMNGQDPKRSQVLAAKWAKAGDWGWASTAAKAAKPPAAGIVRSADDAAGKAIPAITEALKREPAEWIPQWLEFWRVHGEASPAAPVVARYMEQRSKQRATAARLFSQAPMHFKANAKDEAFRVLESLQREAPFSYEAVFATEWLKDRKG